MKKLLIILVLSGCSEVVVPKPDIFPQSCPATDKDCERRMDAETLSAIGQGDAALELMCFDKALKERLSACTEKRLSGLY